MGLLFVAELWAFLATTIETGVMLDTNSDALRNTASRKIAKSVNKQVENKFQRDNVGFAM